MYKRQFQIPDKLLKIWRNSSTKNLQIYKKTKSISHTTLSNKDIDTLFNKIEIDFKDFKSDQATRKSSEAILHYFKQDHSILGGSADLTGSNNTKGKQMSVLDSMNTAGQYIHYGVREHGMAAIMNGIAAVSYTHLTLPTIYSV